MGFFNDLATAFRQVRSRKMTSKDREAGRVVRYDVTAWNYHSFDADILEMDLIRASVDALSRNIAKMQLECVMYDSTGLKKIDTTSDIARVLKRPNPYMTLYDFLYKVSSLYFTQNNVFIWPEYDEKGNLLALWPVNYKNFQLAESERGTLIAKFQLSYRKTYYCAYEDLIHLRNHYTNDDLNGDPNTSLRPLCELLNAQNQGIIGGIRNSAMVRGILKALQVVKEDDLKKARDRFIADNLSVGNSGGVIALDAKYDYQSIESKPYVIDAETMEEAKKKVFDYFGVNEDFLTNNFTSEKHEAVYEGRLEPFALMITQALTAKLYTERERGFRNSIEANMSKLKYQPMSTVTAMITATNQLGLFTRNEYREMLGYAPLTDEQGGNEIMISLNYVNAQNIDEYQEVGNNDQKEEENADQ